MMARIVCQWIPEVRAMVFSLRRRRVHTVLPCLLTGREEDMF